MNRPGNCRARWIVLLLLIGARPTIAADDPPKTEKPAEPAKEFSVDALTKLPEMPPMSVEQCLKGPARDWIVLNTNHVLIVEPLIPRPNTLARRQAAIAEKEQHKPAKRGKELEDFFDELDELKHFQVTLPDAEDQPEYRILVARIKQILHFEDHCLKAVAVLTEKGDLPTAREILFQVERIYPEWPGLALRRNVLLKTEALVQLQAKNPEGALVYLSELHGRDPAFPTLKETLTQPIDGLIASAVATQDWRRAQHFLLKLQRMYPDHETVRKWKNELSGRADALLKQAAEARNTPASAAALAEHAAEIWPVAAVNSPAFRGAVERYQRLRVGVVPRGEWAENPCPGPTERRQRIGGIPLFELSQNLGGTPRYRSRILEDWEPRDLGRQMRLLLRTTHQPADAISRLDATDVADAILRRITAPGGDSADFDERLAGFVRAVEVISPGECRLHFSRTPPRIEPLLSHVVLGTTESADPSAHVAGFSLTKEDGRAVFRRRRPEVSSGSQFHIAEVLELPYRSADHVANALLQGDISVAPDLPDWILRRLEDDENTAKQFFFLKYAVPTNHLLMVNPQSRALRSRELRRALSMSVDREQILRKTILRDPTARNGRIARAPFTSSCYGFDTTTTLEPTDLQIAAALNAAARDPHNKETPQLRLLVSQNPIEVDAVRDLVRNWQRMGITVTAATHGESHSEDDWDLRYVTVQMPDPIDSWSQFLSGSPIPRTRDLFHLDDALRRDLFASERQSDWNSAVNEARSLQRRFLSEMIFIPLWEVDQQLVVRRTIRNVPPRPWHAYDDIDHWASDAFVAGR